MTPQEAVLKILERYPDCDCDVVRRTTPLKVSPGDCRSKWPGQHSEWCAHCIAKEAIES